MKVWLVLSFVCLGCAGSTSPGESPGTAGTGGHAGSNTAGSSGANAGGGAGIAGGGSAGLGTGGNAGAFGVVGQLHDFLNDPAYPDGFWQPATFEEAHVDQTLIAAALERIAMSDWEIHSLLVARHGKLVVERYGWNLGAQADVPGTPHQTLPNQPQALWSSTKSVLSALLGIAIDEGLISGVDAPVKDWFPDFGQLNPTPEKEAIKLEDLLTMRSGLELTEPEPSLAEAPDGARAALARPMLSAPGVDWNYSSGNSAILAEVLRVATARTPLVFANEKLFGPIGIASPTWEAGMSGTEHGGFGLWLTAREMARFGELYRNRGVWAGTRVVSSEWVDASTAPRCASDWGGQYAYHWWVPGPELPGFFNTLGAYGQFIYVNPELGLVIVVTGRRPNETAKTEIQGLIRELIVPAAR